MEVKPTSYLEILISRPRPLSVTLGISTLLLALPFVAASLDGQLVALLNSGTWRAVMFAPVILIYILIVSPHLALTDALVIL